MADHDPEGTVYDAVGGADAFLRLALALHERCLADPELNHPFSHDLDPDHVPHLAAYLGEVFGGPTAYSRPGHDHGFVLGIHAGQGMEPDLGWRFVDCFVLAFDDAHLPDDPRLRATLREYMEWAAAEVIKVSPIGMVAPDQAPVPRWGWNGLEPATS
jgi:hemoglobin